ncbi:hypothetical protein [Simiduia agarivorans]|uniref:Uncharacterized protein n=1 Tax=Simiduia agarivorans (strain DSM 21679 / JCM 13881 / BCRC 17597 / SA1) TaxID=1117647 RepID=K4KNU1_SIMAS|nr:hypothetical protein [Simiduia agarivorans]AFU99910.1 hypothetical protein M5M_13860 [Simiduia agarivorans SA1 = DSM 21679]
MKRIFLGLLITMAALTSYYAVFMLFYDSWFPYYYEEYLPTIFVVGLMTIVILPVPVSLLKTSDSDRMGYYRSVVWFNAAIIAICIVVFLYMLSNGVFLSSPGVYQIGN